MMTLAEIEKAGGDADLFSDTFKGCHGFRPHNHHFDSLEDFQARLKSLLDVTLPAAIEEEKRQEAKCAEALEAAVARTMATVRGCDRRRALEILAEAEDRALAPGQHDWAYFEYLMGVPYGYVSSQMGA